MKSPGNPARFIKHICGRSRAGHFQLKRKSRRDRMRVKLKALKMELARRRGRWLAQVVRGYFAYHAVPTNYPSLSAFLYHVKRLWLHTLRRRSQRSRMLWERFGRIAADFLPKPRILHPWPQTRFSVMHPRWKPSA